MKRLAFTLVELLVVIVVIALLAVLVLPTSGNVMARTRMTVCANNLDRLGQAFVLAKDTPGGPSGKASYPEASAWPGVPANAVSTQAIYLCPEDVAYGTPQAPASPMREAPLKTKLGKLEYDCGIGRWPIDTFLPSPQVALFPPQAMLVVSVDPSFPIMNLYSSIQGTDSRGSYVDYHFEDDPTCRHINQSNLGFHSGQFDSDGTLRLYADGSIYVPWGTSDPNWPTVKTWIYNGVTHTNGWNPADYLNTCGNQNDLFYKDKPAFGTDSVIRFHRGQWTKVDGWGGAAPAAQDDGSVVKISTNYAINSRIDRCAFNDPPIVLVDYKDTTIVDMDNTVTAETILLKSARHLGKVNYLKADGTVRTASPLEISPRLYPARWTP
ncbi:MAG: prepilin-type N-terminal cleavage/methylation domain-containing protein [Planctomycetaceae bacterium]|nr:prepilin-type N-terminal cleavage/methylation domain-containing protein [Planctomycetaceae bacterium]